MSSAVDFSKSLRDFMLILRVPYWNDLIFGLPMFSPLFVALVNRETKIWGREIERIIAWKPFIKKKKYISMSNHVRVYKDAFYEFVSSFNPRLILNSLALNYMLNVTMYFPNQDITELIGYGSFFLQMFSS